MKTKTQKENNQPVKKMFVLDTNVLLQDPYCLSKFKEHDVCIPIIVLEELDKFKKGNETININARSFARELQKHTGDQIFNGGINIGKGLGKLTIALGVEYPDEMITSFSEDTPDHRILAICLDRKQNQANVVLVTNDINLQMKAKALGIEAESYRNDSVKDIEKIYEPIAEIPLNEEDWENISKESDGINYSLPQSLVNRPENSMFILQTDILVRKQGQYLFLVKKYTGKERVYGISAKNHEQRFAFDALLDSNIQLVALTGKAGTGKTILSLAAALEQKGRYDEILVARPAMEMSDKTLGFLPGDKDEKIDPYMMPIYDNLAVIREAKGKDKNSSVSIREWTKLNEIQVLVLNFIRGRSLANRFIIIDEAQNLTPHEIKTIITRAGEGTKIVVIGDISQIDSPYLNERSNGLSYLIDKWSGEPEFVHIHLTNGERSDLADKAGRIM